MSKPIRQAELLARIKALQRRVRGSDTEAGHLHLAPFEFDLRQQAVRRDGETRPLTQREYELALFLFLNVDRLLSRGYILETVWGTSPNPTGT